ncbi:MAG: PRC-barrel domain-containing protein [Lutisporaceae bacterium]
MISIFRINDLIDLPVIDKVSAQRLCTIKDVIIDMKEYRIHALICRERFLGRSFEALLFKNVEAISQNGITVTGRAGRMNIRNLMAERRRFQSYQGILGKVVQSSKGEPMGIIRDILVDTSTGIIKAYELSDGYFDDFLRGRRIVELGHVHTLTEKNVDIKGNTAQYTFETK